MFSNAQHLVQYKILTSGSSESTPMTPERATRLESIGFVWATRDPRHVPWETRYDELKEFKAKYGTLPLYQSAGDHNMVRRIPYRLLRSLVLLPCLCLCR